MATMRVFMWTAARAGSADARSPRCRTPRSAGCVLGAGNLRAKFRGELAEDGGDVHADLLEDAAVHDRHDAAATRHAGMVGALPRRAHEPAGRALGKGREAASPRSLQGGAEQSRSSANQAEAALPPAEIAAVPLLTYGAVLRRHGCGGAHARATRAARQPASRARADGGSKGLMRRH